MAESGKLLTKSGESTMASVQSAPVLAYYFSAHWCPPCRKFTPVLADLYKKWNANGKESKSSSSASITTRASSRNTSVKCLGPLFPSETLESKHWLRSVELKV